MGLTMNDKTFCLAYAGRMKIKKAYTMTTVHKTCTDEIVYRVTRNYKNGKQRYIGREYKTHDGAMGMVRHRNACHRDKYKTDIIILNKRG